MNKPAETTIRMGLRWNKKIRGDKPIGGIIHIYMEISQGNSLCNYLYLKQPKMSFFYFFFFLQQNQRKGGRNSLCSGSRG
jgi:hypothetical protein